MSGDFNNKLLNRGVFIINDVKCPEDATIVVTGIARSGTSMMANLLETLGIYIGDRKDNISFEDKELFEPIENLDIEGFLTIVNIRNETYKKWGWKRPNTMGSLVDMLQYLRNPRVIIPFRDPLAISMRSSIANDSDLMLNLIETYTVGYKSIFDFLESVKCPCLLASYEKTLLDPKYLIEIIAEFVGINLSEYLVNLALSQIRPNKLQYVSNTVVPAGYGVLDAINNRYIVKGWSRRIKEKAQTLFIYLDDRYIGSCEANLPREDLKRIGYGDCAFEYDLKDAVELMKDVDNNFNNKAILSIRNSISGNELLNSPKEIKL